MKHEADIETISPWLQVLWEKQGSDLLLATGSEPRIRVDGKLSAIENTVRAVVNMRLRKDS